MSFHNQLIKINKWSLKKRIICKLKIQPNCTNIIVSINQILINSKIRYKKLVKEFNVGLIFIRTKKCKIAISSSLRMVKFKKIRLKNYQKIF